MDEHLKLLKKYKFEKWLKKLTKKLKNKKVLIYGSGVIFKKIKENYDLSALNIVGITDKKYTLAQFNAEDMGYKIIPLSKIAEIKPDYILIATLNTFGVYCNLKEGFVNCANAKILPLIDKPFFALLREVFG